VTFDSLVAAFQRGETPEEIASNYDALSLCDVYQAIGYSYQTEVDAYLERRQASRESVHREVEAQHNSNAFVSACWRGGSNPPDAPVRRGRELT